MNRRTLLFRQMCKALPFAALAFSIWALFAGMSSFTALRKLSVRVNTLETTAITPSPMPTASPIPGDLPDYATLYPELQVQPLEPTTPSNRTVYLTFDDGPSKYTPEILQILQEHNASACWFVVGNSITGRTEQLRQIASAGHTIGLHSDTHDYHTIYESPSAFLTDMAHLVQTLQENQIVTDILRLPGGSINHYNTGIYPELLAELLRRGYRYYDWNVSAQDAVSPAASGDTVYHRVIDGVHNQNGPSIVLMHDTKSSTPAALPKILDTLQSEGYTFAALDSSVPPVAFGYPRFTNE